MTRVYLDDLPDIPDMTITEETLLQAAAAKTRQTDTGWEPIDLTDDQYATPPDPPSLLGLIYTGRRHVLSGAPETAKTLVAYITIITAIRDSWTCAIIDFEMGPTATRRLLTELGATLNELAAIYYVAPNAPPTDNLQALVDHHVQLATIDAAIGAYDAQDLDDNRRQDAEKFAATWINPLWQAGIATLLIDHVVKNTDNRGKFTIGSERKLGSADVHLGLEAIQTISRGTTGLIKVHVHKDRPGYLQKPACTMIHLDSDPDTHHITWNLEPIQHVDPNDDKYRYTHLMEKVSRWLEEEGGAHSGNQIEKAKLGKATYVRKAVKTLVKEQFVGKNETGRGYEYSHLVPYREADDLVPEEPTIQAVPDLVPTSSHFVPDELPTTSSLVPASIERDEGTRSEKKRDDIDVHDPAVQAKLDDYDNDIPF